MTHLVSIVAALDNTPSLWWELNSWWRLGAFVLLLTLAGLSAPFIKKAWIRFGPSGGWSYRRRYAVYLYFRLRSFDIRGLSTQGAFALELQNVYVNLAVDPASVFSISQDPIELPSDLQGEASGNIFSWLRKGGNFAVIGPPGSGKTTLLKNVALTWVDKKSPLPLIPVLLFLREHATTISENPGLNLVHLIENSLRDLPPPAGWFQRHLDQGQCLVMFDGLDEMGSFDLRRKVADWINRQTAAFPRNRFLVSSRPNGYSDSSLDDFNVLRVLPFRADQIERFVRNWYLANEIISHQKDDPGVHTEAEQGAADLLLRIRQNSTLRQLSVNPLLLTMIATVHRYRSQLPGRRVELLAEICEVLLGNWRTARGLEIDLTPRQKIRVLGKLAFEMTARCRREVSSHEAIEAISDALKLVAPTSEPHAFLRSVEDSSGLLVQRENGVHGFAHVVFQEYLASQYILENNLVRELILHVGEPWWEETILLYAAQADATDLVKECLESQPPLLDLASRIAELALTIHVSTRKQLEERANVEYKALSTIENFFLAAGFVVTRTGDRTFELKTAKGRLEQFVPISVRLAKDEHSEQDIIDLMTGNSLRAGQPVGILIYDSSPDALSRIKMADVRLRDGFFVIPLSLRILEKTLANPPECLGLIQEQSARYLPGADLFDDKTAIADTLTFFGRTGVLNEIQSEVVHLNSVGLFGLRKSGKTSILLQLATALRAHPVIHCDLQKYGGGPRFGAELFNEILRRLERLLMARGAPVPESMTSFSSRSPASDVAPEFGRRFNVLSDVASHAGYELPVICLFDEIERVLPFPEDGQEKALEFNAFFGTLRSICQTDRRLVLVATDVHPDCNRINLWAQRGSGTNPVFAFFKEVFLRSFSEEDTRTMLCDIARLMGRSFDDETLHAIHSESGGHPFLARQLASLVCRQNSDHGEPTISWMATRRYVEQPFIHSGLLKSYFAENLWQDLEQRHATAALDVLRIMGSSGDPRDWVARDAVETRLHRNHSEDEWTTAILMLKEMDILAQEGSQGLRYRLQIPLLGRWLRLRMKEDEASQWRIN